MGQHSRSKTSSSRGEELASVQRQTKQERRELARIELRDLQREIEKEKEKLKRSTGSRKKDEISELHKEREVIKMEMRKTREERKALEDPESQYWRELQEAIRDGTVADSYNYIMYKLNRLETKLERALMEVNMELAAYELI